MTKQPRSPNPREARGLSLRKTADHMGISHAYLWDMEEGHRPMSRHMRKGYLAAVKALSKPNAGVPAK